MEKPGSVAPANVDARQGLGRKISVSVLAIVVGVIVDLGGTNVVAGCYSFVIAVSMAREWAAEGLTQAQMQEQLMQSMRQGGIGTIVLTVLGILLSVLGGYVAGRIARRSEVLHGLGVGVGSYWSLLR